MDGQESCKVCKLSLWNALSLYPHDNMMCLLFVVSTDFIGKNVIAPAGMEHET